MTGTRRFQTTRARNHANPRTPHPDQVALYIHTLNRTPQQNAASMTRETLQGLFAVPVLLKDARPRSAIHVRLRNARPLRSPRVTFRLPSCLIGFNLILLQYMFQSFPFRTKSISVQVKQHQCFCSPYTLYIISLAFHTFSFSDYVYISVHACTCTCSLRIYRL